MKRLICRLRGHRWIPRGPFLVEADGGIPIYHWHCTRCDEWWPAGAREAWAAGRIVSS